MQVPNFFKKLSIGYMVDVVKAAALRFPLSFLCAAGLTVTGVLETHRIDIFPDDILARIMLFMAQGAVLALGLQLFAESRKWPLPKSFLFAVPVLGVLAASVFVPDHFSAMQMFLSAAVFLFLLFAPFAGRRVGEDAVWGFNYLSALAVIFGGVSTMILCLGMSAIVASIKYLFEVDISYRIFADIWIIGWGFFFPVYVLAGIPQDPDREGESCTTPVGVSFIANYLMVPMMLVYTAILYAYGLKIIAQWSLPRGNLAYMVTGFGGIGALTHLAVYPMRQSGTVLLRLFYKYFYFLLLGPLSLLAVGIWTRITEYGVTEQRYAIVLCLIWLAFLSALHLARRAQMHIKYVPMVLAALALVASAGPWSAASVSLNSQYARLQSGLQLAGVLSDKGSIQKTDRNVPFETRKDISSILEFLRERSELPRLRSWVEPVHAGLGAEYAKKDDIFECRGRKTSRCYKDYDLPKDIMAAWGMAYVSQWERSDTEATSLNVNAPRTMHSDNRISYIAPYAYMVSFYVYKRHDDKASTATFQMSTLPAQDAASFKTLAVELSMESRMTVKTDTGVEAVFDLAPLVAWAEQTRPREVPLDQLDKLKLLPISGNLKAEFRVENFNAGISTSAKTGEEKDTKRPEDTPWRILNVRGTLLFSVD